MATLTAKWSKPEAVFANGYDARADKAQLWTAEFTQSVDDNDAELLVQGILSQPTEFLWDQATHVLRVVRYAPSIETYLDNRTWDPVTAQTLSEQAGWTWLGSEIGA